ncbi:MAG: hypothetical protein V2I46_11975, partial [Bacteroides sp.]|nr:hypothetical protein [Bacteroides sp.]
MKKIFLITLCLLFIGSLTAQSIFLPSGSSTHDFLERLELKGGKHASQFHSSLKPLERRAAVGFMEEADTTQEKLTNIDRHMLYQFLQANPEWSAQPSDSSRMPVLKHFYAFPQDFFRYHDKDFFLSVNPVLELAFDKEQGVENLHYLNTRGIEVRGMINQKVGFYTFLAENQARFPDFVRRQMQWHRGAVPGEGWTKGFGEGGVDFFTARGYIAFQATENIGFQFGQDRNFSGHGIRSLLLSDYANNYLFLKINTRYKWFHYQNLYANLVDYPIRSLGGNAYDPKYAITHQLSFQITKNFQLGFFENVMVGGSDSLNKRGMDWHYFNPVIFYRAIEHHVGDPDKVTVGMNWEYLITRGLGVYGQVLVNEFYLDDIRRDVDSMLVRIGLRKDRKFTDFASHRNKFGLQVGVKTADIFGIKDLDLQGEVNLIRPFVYQHYDTYGSGLRPASSYSHYSQPLAHPVGANLAEWAFMGRYRPMKNLELSTALFAYTQGRDLDGVNYGSNILLDYRNR